jgi:hypothetical protein
MVGGEIETTKYVLDPSTLGSSEKNHKRFVGLIFDKDGEWTPLAGLMDRTKMDGVAPHTTLSQPYFVNGDPSLVEGIEIEDVDGNWQPLVPMTSTTEPGSSYETWVAVEQLSGVTIAAHKRLQASFVLNEGLLSYTCPNCPEGKPQPVYWVDETGALTADQQAELSSFLNLANKLPLLFGLMIGFGLVLLLVGAGICAMGRKEKMIA